MPEDLNLGQPRTNPTSGRVEGFNPGPPYYIASLQSLLYLQMTPRLLHKLSNKCITTIGVGAEFSVAMDTAGYVWVWGRADSGQVSKAGVLQEHQINK